jgi:hypothetical protein
MAKTLSKTGITNGQTIQPSHVTQSIDAFTATDAYDISLSGSLTLTGNQSVTGSLIVSNSITSSALTSDDGTLFLGYNGFNNITIEDGGDLFINSVGGAIDIESDDRIYIGGDAVISGSLTLDVNGGYQMTASSGNYTLVTDPGTADLPSGASLTNTNGSFTIFYGTYVPITSSLLNGEVIADSVISASGFINEVKYGVDINQQYCAWQDFSPLFSNPPGTNINFVNQLSSIDDGDTNYSVITGDNVFVGGVKGVYIQGSNASEVGASLLIDETSPSGFTIASNDANTTGSDLLTIGRASDGARFFKTRNDGMIILAQLSSSFSASDDADAATKGVPTGGLYHTNGTVKIRLS